MYIRQQEYTAPLKSF